MTASVAAIGLLTATVIGIGSGIARMSSPSPTAKDAPMSTPTPAAKRTPAPSRSPATAITIPAMGLHSRLVALGTNATGRNIETPKLHQAGWYTGSAAPGESGLSLVLGYIRHSATQTGVFADLSKLRPGARIVVARADGRDATYQVTGIRFYPAGHLTADALYQRSRASLLRIVTVGGPLHSGQPNGNAVVSARLVVLSR